MGKLKVYPDGGYHFYEPNPLGKQRFEASCLPKDHNRRVFSKLARQGHSFSDANIKTLKEEPRARKEMSRRYAEVFHRRAEPETSTKEASASSTAPVTSSPKANGATASQLSKSMSCPKAELRCMASGRNIVVLPNSRLPRPRETPDCHQPFPAIRARRNPGRTMDFGGDYVLL